MLAVILGTRPEIIKLSPVIRQLQALGKPFVLIHTNQHYSPDMDRVFFEQLRLPEPDHPLGINGGTPGQQTGRMLEKIEAVLVKEKPACVMVQGDTNTVLAGALAAAKLGIPVAHVEAGLRSFDRRMPEEYNRVLTDHLSDVLFAPTATSADNLHHEGIGSHEWLAAAGPRRPRIIVCGNTVVDATIQNISLAKRPPTPKDYVLLTVHRAENVDDPSFLRNMALALKSIDVPILAPLHPRTVKNLAAFGITLPVTVLPPQGYLEFLALEQGARFIVTDSGGVQEEACTLGIPCITVRQSTDRPETLTVGSNVLAGTEITGMIRAFSSVQDRPRNWANPYGDGTAARTIVRELHDA